MSPLPTSQDRINVGPRATRLVRDWHAYNERIAADMAHAKEMSRAKTETLQHLREMDYSAQEIAELLGISRQAVYDGLRDASEIVHDDESQRLLDDRVRHALRELHNATRDAQTWLAPFFEQKLALTPRRLDQVQGVFARLKGAEQEYDLALHNADRPVPHRLDSVDDAMEAHLLLGCGHWVERDRLIVHTPGTSTQCVTCKAETEVVGPWKAQS